MTEVSTINWFDVIYNYSVLGASILLVFFIVKIVKKRRAKKRQQFN
ncbi:MULTISPECIES: hypothetical protein [Bacilli]|uniref:Uncharacterized protein n=2 Tax=Bacillus TaxID=1386 RepID=Q9X3Z1_BACIU|nr:MULTISPECIES: hypothetical protein [Bacilli]AAD22616.1 unknown [Bacillus subtilis]KIN32249.1 hypothetical protein B4069_4282 [Bacillus subtilis]KIN34275.1 hypothetical protein B4068_4202 [Bacillus subtilis]KIN45735.1 hypothetical protein B4072_4299 [Bacillus subtilis]KIN55416.1 hypothetical protein B4073_4241 [Bacillus subtilis]